MITCISRFSFKFILSWCYLWFQRDFFFPPPSSSFKGSSWHSYSELREAKICFNYLWTDPCAFCTCSCPIPQVPSDLTRDYGWVPPYNRTECNPLWVPLAAWSFALSPSRPRRPIQVTFQMLFNSLPQMAWPLSRTLAVCVVILLLDNSLHGIFSYHIYLWSHRVSWIM